MTQPNVTHFGYAKILGEKHIATLQVSVQHLKGQSEQYEPCNLYHCIKTPVKSSMQTLKNIKHLVQAAIMVKQ